LKLFYDPRDDRYHEKAGSQVLYWLDDVGACPLNEADPREVGFLFAGARPIEDYRQLVAEVPFVRDRPEERQPLLRLDHVLQAIERAGISVPSPQTWPLSLDQPLPNDLTFPLFVRTAESSWKKGGKISRVRTPKELEEEAGLLRVCCVVLSVGTPPSWCGSGWILPPPAREGTERFRRRFAPGL
jgi:hypothetical protein